MTPEQFVYWLQGWTEMEQNKRPNVDQWNMIMSHLALVLTKVTPEFGEGVAACGPHDSNQCHVDDLADIDLDGLTAILKETVEDLNDSPSVMFEFNPPTQHPQVSIPDTLICSAGQDETRYCSAPKLPRKLHND